MCPERSHRPDPLTSSLLCFLWQKEQGAQKVTHPTPRPPPPPCQLQHSQPGCHCEPGDHSANPTVPFAFCLIPKQLQTPRSHFTPYILIIPLLSSPPAPPYLLKTLPRCSLERTVHSSAKSTQRQPISKHRSAVTKQKSLCYLKPHYRASLAVQ